VDFNGIDSVSITVTSDKDGEGVQYPKLLETTASSGVFTGSMSTVRSASLGATNTGSMNLVAGFIA
jgi:hypothetical protein